MSVIKKINSLHVVVLLIFLALSIFYTANIQAQESKGADTSKSKEPSKAPWYAKIILKVEDTNRSEFDPSLTFDKKNLVTPNLDLKKSEMKMGGVNGGGANKLEEAYHYNVNFFVTLIKEDVLILSYAEKENLLSIAGQLRTVFNHQAESSFEFELESVSREKELAIEIFSKKLKKRIDVADNYQMLIFISELFVRAIDGNKDMENRFKLLIDSNIKFPELLSINGKKFLEYGDKITNPGYLSEATVFTDARTGRVTVEVSSQKIISTEITHKFRKNFVCDLHLEGSPSTKCEQIHDDFTLSQCSKEFLSSINESQLPKLEIFGNQEIQIRYLWCEGGKGAKSKAYKTSKKYRVSE